MARTVAIAGKEYEVRATLLKMLPFLKAVGGNTEEARGMSEASPEERQAYAEKILSLLEDPANHYPIAFSLAKILPDVPADLLDVRGPSDYTLELDIPEILQAYLAGMQAIAEQQRSQPERWQVSVEQGNKPEPRTQPQGFAQDRPTVPPTKPEPAPKVIMPEVVPAVPSALAALTPEDAEMLMRLSDGQTAEIKQSPTYTNWMQAIGVSEALYKLIKSR